VNVCRHSIKQRWPGRPGTGRETARNAASNNHGMRVGFKAKYMKKLLIVGLAIAGMAALSARADDAKAIWEKDCAKCHGADGKGQTKMGQKLGVKDYTDPKVQAEMKDEEAAKAIKEGLKDKEGKVLMKPAENLSDADIKGLIAYIRSFKK
jgi:cytochrome c553